MNPSQKALVIIDVQNDYFPEGKLPLWQEEKTLQNIISLVNRAREKGMHVILVQHVVDASAQGPGFFIDRTQGVNIHPALLRAASDAPILWLFCRHLVFDHFVI